MEKPEMPKLGTKEGWAAVRAKACAHLADGILKDVTVEKAPDARTFAVAKKWLQEGLEALEEIGVPEWEDFLKAEYEKTKTAAGGTADTPGSNPGAPSGA